jgi:hypothetical protein
MYIQAQDSVVDRETNRVGGNYLQVRRCVITVSRGVDENLEPASKRQLHVIVRCTPPTLFDTSWDPNSNPFDHFVASDSLDLKSCRRCHKYIIWFNMATCLYNFDHNNVNGSGGCARFD